MGLYSSCTVQLECTPVFEEAFDRVHARNAAFDDEVSHVKKKIQRLQRSQDPTVRCGLAIPSPPRTTITVGGNSVQFLAAIANISNILLHPFLQLSSHHTPVNRLTVRAALDPFHILIYIHSVDPSI